MRPTIMNVKILSAFFILNEFIKCAYLSCAPRYYANGGIVCVCTASRCDDIGPITKPESYQFVVYTSNSNGLRFDKQIGTFEEEQTEYFEVYVDHDVKYQHIHGFGGAFTDSACINIDSLEDKTKDHLLRSYFSENGIEYNLCRVPMGGTDFSTHAYSYYDGKEDKNLTHFKLTSEDRNHKIPLIKSAQRLSNNKLKVFASAWTAPKWMKSNGQYAGNGVLKPDMYQTWSDYFVKFLDSYKKMGVTFWGITTGNEPSLAQTPTNKINSIKWNARTMSKWISESLGPTLRKSQHSTIKLMAIDDQRSYFPWFVSELFQNEKTRSYVDGLAVHWYSDQAYTAYQLTQTQYEFSDKFILATEACSGNPSGSLQLGLWSTAEKYADDIIQDLQNWVTGWVDWNMVLDLKGGPSYIKNGANSPIIVNRTAGEFYKQPTFYALGHFSKFIPRGSVRIGVEDTSELLQIVGFERPDGGTAIIILNKFDDDVSVSIIDYFKGVMNLEISAKSIATIIYW